MKCEKLLEKWKEVEKEEYFLSEIFKYLKLVKNLKLKARDMLKASMNYMEVNLKKFLNFSRLVWEKKPSKFVNFCWI